MGGERVEIPLFPLGMVLTPGLLLPLHVFEERYRTLVRDLQALPEGEPARFGVLGIRHGREVGADNVHALYEIGTTATVQRVDEQPDGRYELVCVGTERFRLLALHHDHPYLTGTVELLEEIVGGEAVDRAPAVLAAYRTYLDVLGETRGAAIDLPDLPLDPTLLGWLVAATVLVDLPVRQRLLEEPTVAARLDAEGALLHRETALLRSMASAPAPDLTRAPQSPN
ncbi:MAG TPA: LON peptidase substrate-binding domain-containing protein [Mycobacteriales bacterium]